MEIKIVNISLFYTFFENVYIIPKIDVTKSVTNKWTTGSNLKDSDKIYHLLQMNGEKTGPVSG